MTQNVTKKFCLVVYRLLKGKGLRFFSGPKNYGHVISKETTKGKYDPRNLKLTLQFQMNVISEPRIEYLGD